MSDIDNIFGTDTDFPEFLDFLEKPEPTKVPAEQQVSAIQQVPVTQSPTVKPTKPEVMAAVSLLDLGSDDTELDFSVDDADAEAAFETESTGESNTLAEPTPTFAVTVEESENPLEAAMDATEFGSIFSALPVFEHGAVTEDITDITQTFDALRLSKTEDFPELEDEKRVSWTVTYGKVVKYVSDADSKKKKIGEFKKSIESSKEFLDALKKSKDKKPRCVLKPKITAQSKGDGMPSYKGIFTNADEAEQSGKVISIIPGQDGYVYETRRSKIGIFTTRTTNCRELSVVAAGFIPALPRLPMNLLLEVISFFRAFMREGVNHEAIVNVLWDKELNMFCSYVPPQVVTYATAIADLSVMPDPDRYLHYMDIHSHNVMPAIFSKTDDRDEKATRVYAVIGRLDRYMPEISVRISNGGKYLPIAPDIVFEPLAMEYPARWHDSVTTICSSDEEARAA
jgi:PRTRC genetic system protein A